MLILKSCSNVCLVLAFRATIAVWRIQDGQNKNTSTCLLKRILKSMAVFKSNQALAHT